MKPGQERSKEKKERARKLTLVTTAFKNTIVIL